MCRFGSVATLMLSGSPNDERSPARVGIAASSVVSRPSQLTGTSSAGGPSPDPPDSSGTGTELPAVQPHTRTSSAEILLRTALHPFDLRVHTRAVLRHALTVRFEHVAVQRVGRRRNHDQVV